MGHNQNGAASYWIAVYDRPLDFNNDGDSFDEIAAIATVTGGVAAIIVFAPVSATVATGAGVYAGAAAIVAGTASYLDQY